MNLDEIPVGDEQSPEGYHDGFEGEGEEDVQPFSFGEALSDGHAEYAMNRLHAIQAERMFRKVFYEQRLAELETDEAKWHRRYDIPLRDWALIEAKKRKRKTITLGLGEISLRTEGESVKIDKNSASFNQWAKERDLVAQTTTIKESVDLNAAARLALTEVRETGELPEWAARIPAGETARFNAIKKEKKKDANQQEFGRDAGDESGEERSSLDGRGSQTPDTRD